MRSNPAKRVPTKLKCKELGGETMKLTRKMLFGVLGVLSTVLSIVCYSLGTGSYESYKTYGGDAYTGIQQASAQAANNIQDLAGIAKFGLGSILLIVGLLLIVLAITKADTVDYSFKLNSLEKNTEEIISSIDEIKLKLVDSDCDSNTESTENHQLKAGE